MTLHNGIVSFLVAIGASLVVALIATLIVWNIQIEHRAFQCADDTGFGTFWEDMDAHQRARDTVSPGWTWHRLKRVETTYKRALILIWFAGTLAAGAIILSRVRHELYAQNA